MAKTREETSTTFRNANACDHRGYDGTYCAHERMDKSISYCVLHTKERKGLRAFRNTLEQEIELQRENKILNLDRIVFPASFHFSNVLWESFEGISARGTVFHTANFNKKVFKSKADFRNARFKGIVEFSDAQFEIKTDFRRAVFEAESNFEKTNFYQGADFYKATFFEAEFISLNKEAGSKPQLNFTRAKLAESYFSDIKFAWGTTFELANLTRTEFYKCDVSGVLWANSRGLEKCQFSNPIKFKKLGHWRIVADQERLLREDEYMKLVGEEIEQSPKPPYETVQRIYRELKVNYESHKNFPDAGHFHYGEMEMIRLGGKGKLNKVNSFLLSWYKGLSAYGERVGLALIWFLLVLLLGAALYMWQGFTINMPPRHADYVAQRVIDNEPREKAIFLNPLKMKELRHWTQTAGHSAALSIRTSFLRGGGTSKSLSPYSSIMMFLQSLFGPLTFGALVLAIRRQLRRN